MPPGELTLKNKPACPRFPVPIVMGETTYMQQIVHIISSPKGNDSHSYQLGKAIIRQLLSDRPDAQVTERNLFASSLPFLGGDQVAAFMKQEHEWTPCEQQSVLYSDELLQEVEAADILVIGAPMYNYSIHASLKAWIDQVVRIGRTVQYSADGTRSGMLKNKKAFLAIACGGHYSGRPFDPVSRYIEGYLTLILDYIGITDVTAFKVEGTIFPDFSTDYEAVVGGM